MRRPSADTLTIAAIGDFMLERRPAADDVASVKAFLDGHDVVIANVDAVLSELGTPVPKWANLRGPRDAAHDLRAMGIDLIAMANNHAMDFRAEGMLDTRRAYDEAELLHAGAGENLEAATAPVVVTRKGRRVAMLAMSCTLPFESAAGPNWPGIAPVHVKQAFVVDESLLTEQPGTLPEVKTWLDQRDLARARADVAAARAVAEIVLPVVHWGVPSPWRAPFYPVIQEYQRTLGHALIDAGADAVIGNHAHELHGFEVYRGRPIAYCLGNFWIDTISSYPWMGSESMVYRLLFAGNGPARVEVVPLLLDEGGVPRRDPSARAIPILDRLSRELGATVVEQDGRFVVEELP